MSRIAFLVDGFNLYHSLKKAEIALGGRGTRWLDLKALCASHLQAIGKTARLGPVHYFSALAHHMEATKPGVTSRHQAYIDCLIGSGVTVELSKFKTKTGRCWHCGRDIVRHEEKETDVAIGVRLLDLFVQGACDEAVVVTGDSDIVPAVRCARRLFPGKPVYACFPFYRQSLELKSVATRAFQISKTTYLKHQLPEPFPHPDGRQIRRPTDW